MIRYLGAFGALCCLGAVLMGAYVSHAQSLAPDVVHRLEIAVRYQFWHGLALLLLTTLPISAAKRSFCGLMMALGTILFSGSLYGLSLIQGSFLGWLTPVGGCALILSWAILVWAFINERQT